MFIHGLLTSFHKFVDKTVKDLWELNKYKRPN